MKKFFFYSHFAFMMYWFLFGAFQMILGNFWMVALCCALFALDIYFIAENSKASERR